jgi:hypothetical protein
MMVVLAHAPVAFARRRSPLAPTDDRNRPVLAFPML